MTLAAFQSWVVQTGLVVSFLIIIILIIRRPFARAFGANAAYALWSLPLIRVCLPGLSIPHNWVPAFLRQASTPPETPPLEFRSEILPPASGQIDAIAPLPVAAPDFMTWGAVMIGIWLGVAVLWLGYQLIQQVKSKAHLISQSAEPIGMICPEIERAAAKVGLRKTPKVRIAADGTGPLVTGLFKPLVILPSDFSKTFDAQQRHFALVHEFAHIKRRDLWAALVTLVFRAVNWPNPLVHYGAHKLRGDQEAACDAFVVKVTGGQTAHSYAETLVKAIRQNGETSQKNAHLALSLTQADAENSKGD